MGWYRFDILGSRLAFTDRRGGISTPPWDALNLSYDQGDESTAVDVNRETVARFLGVSPGSWQRIRQVHGTDVALVGDGDPTREVDADAAVVRSPGTAGLIMTADCAPLALVSERGVAAVHGGWAGLLDGVVAAAVRRLGEVAGAPGVAVLGPCIRPCCYEFGDDDLDRMAARFGSQVRSVTSRGTPALDLPAVVRSALEDAGIEGPVVDSMHEIDRCTACSPDYFSHRRETEVKGATGRQGLLVSRVR